MIKLLNENTPFPLFDDGVFSLRQRAFFNSYGTNAAFFQSWIQTDENKTVTAVITSLSGDVTLALCENADFEEINEFLAVIGFSSVFLNREYSKCFPSGKKQNGIIMKLEKKLPKTDIEFKEPDFRSVFNLLFNDENVSFSDWFTDVTLRIRRGTAYADTFILDGKTVACAFCQATDGKSALIGSVKTDEKYRNKGIGTLLVTRLSSYLQNKGLKVYLCREENKNKDFYSQIGFKNCGEWTSIKNE